MDETVFKLLGHDKSSAMRHDGAVARWRGGAVVYSGSTKRNRICVKAPGSLIRRGSSNINIFHRHGFPVVRGTESILEFYEADFVFCEHLAR